MNDINWVLKEKLSVFDIGSTAKIIFPSGHDAIGTLKIEAHERNLLFLTDEFGIKRIVYDLESCTIPANIMRVFCKLPEVKPEAKIISIKERLMMLRTGALALANEVDFILNKCL